MSSSAPPQGIASSLPSGIATLDIVPPPSVGFGPFVERRECCDNRLIPACQRPCLIDHVIDRAVDCHCRRRQRGHWRSVGRGSHHGLIRHRRDCPFCQVAVPLQTTSDFVEHCHHITLILVVILFVLYVVALVIIAVRIGRRIAVGQQQRKTDDKTAATTTTVGRSAMTEDDGWWRQYLPPLIPPSAVRFLWGPFLSGRARRSKSVAA